MGPTLQSNVSEKRGRNFIAHDGLIRSDESTQCHWLADTYNHNVVILVIYLNLFFSFIPFTSFKFIQGFNFNVSHDVRNTSITS